MPPADFWDEEDEWYSGARHVRAVPVPPPAPRRPRVDRSPYERRTSEFLVPEVHYSSGLHRTRSQGASPAPNVTIYNTTRMDNESSPNVHTEQRSPLPSPRQEATRGRRRLADDFALEDEVERLKYSLLKTEIRDRSRSRHRYDDSPPHHHHYAQPPPAAAPNNEYEKWQLQMANERLKQQEEERQQEKREELIKRRMELEYMNKKAERDAAEAHIKADEDRLRKEWELKLERDERKRKDELARAREEEEHHKHEWELKMEREERKKKDQEAKEKAERERLKQEWELKQEREDRKRAEEAKKRDEERQRIIAENLAKLQAEERKVKEERQRAVDAFNKEKAEKEAKAKEERERHIMEYERKKSDEAEKAKKQREELIMQLRIEEEKQKAKDKEEWERFLQKQKAKEEEEKAKKAKHEAELEESMRKRLAQFGFQENQIQAMIKPEEAAKLQHSHQHQGMTPLNPLRLTQQPTYVKVHKDHLAIDTLLYYDIPYEVDRSDPSYIIILREMDSKETEILFEHTRRLRSRGSSRLLIEERTDHGKPDYAWVRRKKNHSVSPSRRRSSPKRVVGIKEMFF